MQRQEIELQNERKCEGLVTITECGAASSRLRGPVGIQLRQ